MDAGEVFRKHGAPKCWTTPGSTVDGIGFTLGHGSWPVFDARQATTRRAVVRNPAVLDETARWTGTWQPRHLTGIWFIDYFAGIAMAGILASRPAEAFEFCDEGGDLALVSYRAAEAMESAAIAAGVGA